MVSLFEAQSPLAARSGQCSARSTQGFEFLFDIFDVVELVEMLVE